MNARQAKKYRKKVVMPFFMMDEMCLISMTQEEQKEYFKARKMFMERYCQYKHYRDKGNIDNIHQKYYNFPWPVAEKMLMNQRTQRKEYVNEFIKSETEYPCCVCGTVTNLVEINYQAPFCGDECVNVMDKASVTGKRNPLF